MNLPELEPLFAAVQSEPELVRLVVSLLGRSGEFHRGLRELVEAPPETRKELGRQLNEAVAEVRRLEGETRKRLGIE